MIDSVISETRGSLRRENLASLQFIFLLLNKNICVYLRPSVVLL